MVEASWCGSCLDGSGVEHVPACAKPETEQITHWMVYPRRQGQVDSSLALQNVSTPYYSA
jgi:hypothetical protein